MVSYTKRKKTLVDNQHLHHSELKQFSLIDKVLKRT